MHRELLHMNEDLEREQVKGHVCCCDSSYSLFYFLWGGLNLLKMNQERFNRYLLFEAGIFGKQTLEHDRQQFV